ncbi:MAG: hypothetical protein DRR06_15725 [Gammaproteobacteria bacterium]|nr:MAG: hypothetical protein DRR06_15725 [Gammaproteobacteria bacterium]
MLNDSELDIDEPEIIGIQALVAGAAYFGDGRNFDIAIWDGSEFHGLRYKLGDTFMDTEWHYDRGAPHGTFKPYKVMG